MASDLSLTSETVARQARMPAETQPWGGLVAVLTGKACEIVLSVTEDADVGDVVGADVNT